MLPVRFPQVALTRALCVPRCLKSFPISVLHTITPLHRCRYAMPLLANTSIRRAREWFSSWPGLPRFCERETHIAFLKGGSNQIAKVKKGYEGWRTGGRAGKEKRMRSKGGTCGERNHVE